MTTLFETVTKEMEKIVKDFIELLPDLETDEETSNQKELTNREKALLYSAIGESLLRRRERLFEVKKHQSLYNPYVIKAYEDDYATLKSLIDRLGLGGDK